MGFNWGSAASGAGEGAKMGAMTGDPLMMLVAALGKGAMDGFSGDEGAGGGMEIDGSNADGEGGGFDMSTITNALGGLFGGGMGEAGAEEKQPGLNDMKKNAESPFMPPNLMGFPSLSAPKISELLKNAISSRQKGVF